MIGLHNIGRGRGFDHMQPDDSNGINRRTAVKLFGATASLGTLGIATAGRHEQNGPGWRLEKIGHSLLSNPVGEFTEGQIREDGRYGVVGSYLGDGGSFLVDLEDPSDPREVHNIPAQSPDTRNADVKFDPRYDVYYRTQESHETDGPSAGPEGTQVVDYGYADGTPSAPEIIAHIPSGDTHNVFPHPEVPVLYTVDGPNGGAGLKVFDVSRPERPDLIGTVGPDGYCHDVVVDPERELAHAAFMSGNFSGYAIYDVSDPRQPEIRGLFDYGEHPDYSETNEVGEEGFGSGHYAAFDPRRGLAIVGDEKGTGVPGGKHIFDIGWDEGSLENPIPISFFVSPNAKRQIGPFEQFDWTGHNFTVLPRGDATLLVSSDYKDGTVVYDITDPRNPRPIDQYLTDEKAEEASPTIFPAGEPPMAFGVQYNEQEDLFFVTDMVTGVYTLELTRVSPERERGRPF